MKFPKFMFFLLFCSVLLSACKSKKNLRIENSTDLSLIKIGSIDFRRSYVDHESHTDVYNDSVMKSNPELMDCSDSSLIEKFRKIGLIKSNQLIINKFQQINSIPFNLINSENDTVSISTDYIKEKGYYGIIANYKNSKMTVHLNKNNLTRDTKIDTIDIINGGFKEVVVLERYYIMNGDNYMMSIFRIN
ncbi:MAG TPA: hypothetical protein PKI86_04690 [Chitinophagales bacterium]|nr:hypothetical protein [Chitinophagales bacterium]